MIPPFQTTFAVPLSCESCIKEVSTSLYNISGISNVDANLKDQLVSVEGTAAPSTIVAAIQSTGRDAILRGSGASNSAAVCILETHSTKVANKVRGLARMVQVSPTLTLVDLTIQGLSPGKYTATVRESGNITDGAASTGGIWGALKARIDGKKPAKGIFGTVEVGQNRMGSVFFDRPVQIWEMIGRSMVVSKQQEGRLKREDPDTLVGVIARSAGVWDNDKTEIETWVQALGHYDNNEFEEALKSFSTISDTSKILFNCGVIHATLGEHGKAVECYQKAVRLDQYFAVAYFQQGVSNFLVGDFEEALANFNDTLLYLRGNTFIDYEQLGLKFKLYSCEVLFNRGLCYIYLQQKGAGLQDFQYAIKEKQVDDHNVIDDAIKEEAEAIGLVYRPNSAKVKNLKTKDYLGKARLVAASDRNNAFTGFAGMERKLNAPVPEPPKDDRPPDAISFAASNLVKPDLRSRNRQQSEPPITRQMFPPTPPPDNEKTLTLPNTNMADAKPADTRAKGQDAGGKGDDRTPQMTGRALSVRSGTSRPERLDLSKVQGPQETKERPRLGTIRTASEPRGPSRNYNTWRSPVESPGSRLGRGTPLRQQGNDPTREYTDELYDMYSGSKSMASPPHRGASLRGQPRVGEEGQDAAQKPPPRRPSNGRGPPGKPQRRFTADEGYGDGPRRMNSFRPQYIDEEEEFVSDEYEGSDFNEGDFEMMSGPNGGLRSRKPSVRIAPRAPEVQKIRVKVHVGEDTRYIVIGPAVEYFDFTDRVRDKFSLRSRFRLRIKDEGDMITLADQDDLDLALSTAKTAAKREASDMGKMEIQVYLLCSRIATQTRKRNHLHRAAPPFPSDDHLETQIPQYPTNLNLAVTHEPISTSPLPATASYPSTHIPVPPIIPSQHSPQKTKKPNHARKYKQRSATYARGPRKKKRDPAK
ncbi:MAG: hypothetical protein M1833_001723, partial [Piccolia ochrophora]